MSTVWQHYEPSGYSPNVHRLPAVDFRIAAQPIVSLASSSLIWGRPWYEFLIRPCGDAVRLSPMDFVRKIYGGKVGLTLDNVMVDAACRYAAKNPGFRISVNIHPRSLGDENFVQFVEDSLESHHVDASRLCLEIVENFRPGPIRSLVAGAERLAQAGVVLALDDFGVGEGSIQLLDALPIRVLKIDRQFVQKLEYGKRPRMLSSLLALATGMGAAVVAEGIESKLQLQVLTDIGIGYGQGYFLGRPELVQVPT